APPRRTSRGPSRSSSAGRPSRSRRGSSPWRARSARGTRRERRGSRERRRRSSQRRRRRSSHRRRGACVRPTIACTRMRALWPRLFWPVVALVVVTVAALLFRNALILGFRRWTGQRATEDRLVVLVVGGLVLLSSLGIAVTPILTALGVGGLAVALALQDTLSNLFAGIHLLADKPIRVGDYVRLSAENVEGHVVDVGWRSTRL